MTTKVSKREKLAIKEAAELANQARNTNVMDAMIRGQSKKAIALANNISVSTVNDIIRDSKDAWRDYRIEDYDLLLTIELERINRIEAEAWDAYEKSKKPLVTQTRHSDGQYDPAGKLIITKHEIKTQDRHPDPRYMNIIQWCTEQRLKIMGGYAPEKHAATTPDGKSPAPFQQVTFIEVVRPVAKAEDVIVQALPEGS